MRRSAGVLVSALVTAATLSQASAAEPLLEERWRHPDRRTGRFEKALVVVIAADDRARRDFENKFVSHLRGRDIECITSYSLVPDLRNVQNPAEVADTLLGQAVDAVITVRLLPAEAGADAGYDGWADLAGETLRARDYVQRAMTEPAEAAKEYVAVFGLWETGVPGRVWAARTPEHKLKKLRKLSGEIVQEILRGLRIDDLL
jgi:hypothetical protein